MDHSWETAEAIATLLAQVRSDTCPAIELLINNAGEPAAVNQACRRLIAENRLKSWDVLLVPEDCSRWQRVLRDSTQRQIPASGYFHLKRFDGARRRFVLRAEPKYDSRGTFIGHLMSGMDISDLGPAVKLSETKDDKEIRPEETRHRFHQLVADAAAVRRCSEQLSLLLPRPTSPDIEHVLFQLRQAGSQLISALSLLTEDRQSPAPDSDTRDEFS